PCSDLPMTESDLLNWFRDYCFREIGVRKDLVTPEANFVADLAASSLDLIGLVMELEDIYQFTISESEIEGIRTVGDAIRYITTRTPDGNSNSRTATGE